MKISPRTVDIIGSIKAINQGVVFKKGSVIKAKKERGTMPLIFAKVEEEFPVDFAIYNLSKFQQIMSLMQDPEITFEENNLLIKDSKKSKATIAYAAERLIDSPDYSMSIVLPNVDFEVDLDVTHIRKIKQAAQQLGCEEIAFVGNGKTIQLQTYSVKKSDPDYFSFEVGETDKHFKFVISITHLQFIPDSYKVLASLVGIVEFRSSLGDLSYFMTAHEQSKL